MGVCHAFCKFLIFRCNLELDGISGERHVRCWQSRWFWEQTGEVRCLS